MPITIQHQVPVATAGGIAYEAGLGEFQKEADKFYEGQRQFDEQLALQQAQFAESQAQFDRTQNYRYDLASMQNAMQGRKLDESAYQFDLGMQDRGLDRMARYQMADERNQLAGQEIEQRGASALSRETRADQRLMQTQMNRTGLAAAASINGHQFRSEEQKQQAVDQWVQKFGDYFNGQFPFQTQYQANPNNLNTGEAMKRIESMLGPGSEDRAGELYGRLYTTDPETGEQVPVHETAAEQADYIEKYSQRTDKIDAGVQQQKTARLVKQMDSTIKLSEQRNKVFEALQTAAEDWNKALTDLDDDNATAMQKRELELMKLFQTPEGAVDTATVSKRLAAFWEALEASKLTRTNSITRGYNERSAILKKQLLAF